MGLDDVIAADTAMSRVDGVAGELILKGLPLSAATHMGFESLAAHLWDSDDLVISLGEQRILAYEKFSTTIRATHGLRPIEQLRALLGSLQDASTLADTAVRLTASMGVAVAMVGNLAAGEETPPPDPALPHVEDLARMLKKVPRHSWKGLEVYLGTVADHGLNASTFAARVVASTQASMTSAVVAALGALEGPLHGGAPGPVLDMLDAVGSAENAEAWVEEELDAGRRLMGFGHRVYRVRDPRADVLRAEVLKLESPRIDLALAVEKAALKALRRRKPDRVLATNVEFYTALLLDALGVHRSLFTPMFAAGRVVGWCGHVLEQRATGRLLRPRARYVGPEPGAAA